MVIHWSWRGHISECMDRTWRHGQIDTNCPTWRSVFCIWVQETISASAPRICFLLSWIWVHYAFTRIWTPNIWSNQYFFVCNMRFHLNFDKNFAKMCQNVETNNKRYWLLQHGASLQWPLHGVGLCRNQAVSTSEPADAVTVRCWQTGSCAEAAGNTVFCDSILHAWCLNILLNIS